MCRPSAMLAKVNFLVVYVRWQNCKNIRVEFNVNILCENYTNVMKLFAYYSHRVRAYYSSINISTMLRKCSLCTIVLTADN